MNALRNKVQLIGNLAYSPEVRIINNRKVAKMALITNETYKNDKGERVSENQFHNLIAWGRVAEAAEEFLKRGSEIAIEGKLISRTYTDKEGVKRYITEIEVGEILMLDTK